MKCLFLVFLLVQITNCLSQPHFSSKGGTLVITGVTKDSIIIVGDTREGDMSTPNVFDTVSKINHYKKTFFAMAGTADMYIKDTLLFEVFDTIKYEIKKSKKFDDILGNVTTGLNNCLRWFDGHSKNEISFLFKYDLFIMISIAKFEHNKPHLLKGTFKILHEDNNRYSTMFIPDSENDTLPYSMGHLQGLNNYYTLHPHHFTSQDLNVDFFINLIKIERDAFPQAVNCPIDVYVIKKKGFKYTRYACD